MNETLTEAHQLDALPLGSIVVDASHFPWQKVHTTGPNHAPFTAPMNVWLSFGSTDLHSTPSIMRHGPFTVLTTEPLEVRKMVDGALYQ